MLSTFKKIGQDESVFFDSIRGFSAFVVLIGHCYQLLVQPSFENKWLNLIFYNAAGYAVMIFFLLSGYMISMSLYRNISDNHFTAFNFKKFFYARLLRLYPPLILAFLIMLSVFLITDFFNINFVNGNEVYLSRDAFKLDSGMFASLLFMQNIFRHIFPQPCLNGPLWSLSFEFWFYMIGAAIIGIMFDKHNIKKYLIPFVILGVTFLIFGKTKSFLLGFLIWTLGALLAVVHQNPNLINKFKTKKWFICKRIAIVLIPLLWLLTINKYLFTIMSCYIIYFFIFHKQDVVKTFAAKK